MADQPVSEAQVAPQVQPSAELPANATPDAFGAEIGTAAENTAEVLTRLHRDAVTRANQTAVLDADNQVNGFLNNHLYDPKSGVLYQNLGKDAPGAVDKTLTDFDQHVAKVSSGLTNDEQRIQFQRMAQARRFDLDRQLGHYEHQETTRYANETDDAAISMARDTAIQNAGTNDPELSPEHFIEKQRAVIADRGQRLNLPPEAIQAQMNEAESTTHLGVVTTLVSAGQDQQAKAWLEDHKEELLPRDLTRARAMVDEGSTRDRSRQISDGILASQQKAATKDDGSVDSLKVNLKDALDRLEGMGIKDTRVYDQAKSRLVADFRLQEQARTEQQKNVMQQIGDYMDDENNATHEIPIPLYTQLDHQNRQAVDLWKKKMDQEGAIKTDPSVHEYITRALADPEQWDDLLQKAPEQARPYLSDHDYLSFVKEYEHVKTQVDKRDNKLSQGMIATNVVHALFNENGLETPKDAKPGSDAYQQAAERQMRFLSQLKKSVAADQGEKKRELTEPEIREHAKDLFAQQSWVTQRSSLNPLTWLNRGLGDNSVLAKSLTQKTETGAAFEAPFADKIAYDVKQIPAADYAQAIKGAESSGFKLPKNADGSLTSEARRIVVAAYNRKLADEYRKSVTP